MSTAIGTYAVGTAVKARAGITDTNDDTLLGLLCDQVNAYIEQTTGRVLAPISGTATLYYDGDGSNRIYLPVTASGDYPFPGGLRTIATLGVSDYTGADYTTLAATDYFLRGKSQPSAPFDWLYLSDWPAGSYYTFPKGFNTVKVTSTGAGWAAIPDDVIDVAETLVIKLWHARETGYSGVVGTDETGATVVSRMLDMRDRYTLRAYTLPGNLA
jgi:hypothetical protein